MKKFLPLFQISIINTYIGTISCKAGCTSGPITCNCNFKFVADSVTFNENNELIFVNKTFNLEKETEAFQSYTKTNTDMEELNPSNLINNDNEMIHLYILKVGYSPNCYYCFKYNDKIYILKEENGKYLLPIAEKNNDKSFKETINCVCVLGNDNNKFFLLKKKFENKISKALVLDDFISNYKYKSKKEKMQVTILDEEKEKENLKRNNGIITINNIQINIGTINNINNTQNISQNINIVKN